MKLSIVGYGIIGKYYLNLIKKNFTFSEIYIIDRIFKKKKIKKKITFLNFLEFKKQNLKINYAIICTPSNLHFKYACYFLDRKVQTLIEKPFVLRIDHAKKLIKFSQKKKTDCLVCFQNRFNKSISFVKKKINSKKLKKIFFVDCSLYWRRNLKYYQNSWRGKYETDGGVLVNQAIHLLDIIIYLFGPIKNFNGLRLFNKKKLDTEDTISLNFYSSKNILISFKATTRAAQDYGVKLDIFSEKKRFLIEGISLNNLFFFKGKKKYKFQKFSESFKNPLGYGHMKVLKIFFSKTSYRDNLKIQNNIYVLKLIHSIYNYLDKKKIFTVVEKQSILGV